MANKKGVPLCRLRTGWVGQRRHLDVWEKENVLSSQSFAQNLEEKIKEAETKLDKLVNAFLDGS
ncbi:hypothetical protein KJ980_04380, partial [Patescibacteria group bacterium]|nr:hypothetical protein [Patescibacteria group bacterium]